MPLPFSTLVVMGASLAMAPFAIAGNASSQFKITVHLQQEARLGASPVRSVQGAKGAVLFGLPGGEQFKVRFEVIDPAVQSVEVSWLGRTIRVAKEPVEVTLPIESNDAIHESQLTLTVKYREGAQSLARDVPIRVTLAR